MTCRRTTDLINPPALTRPAPFWSWNDKLDNSELIRQIHEMADKGWGSYFMHSRVGLVTGYLSDEWMQLINDCAEEAEKTGTYAWLYDEDKWPSGFAGGEVPEKDERFRSRALVLLKSDQITVDDTILTEVDYRGQHYLICKRISPLGSAKFNGASYSDLMNPEAVREFINCTHERYKQSCGSHFGIAIPGLFTDEPCYLYHRQYEVPVVPWSDYLPEFFEKHNSYDVLQKLPQLFFDVDDYRKVRIDFYTTATELFKQNFTKQYYDWCENNNLIMTGHFMAEDYLWYQTQWSGDVMSHYEFMHWPGIDKLGRDIELIVTCKQLSSVVDQLGKERALSEVFGCIGQQSSFFHRKWIADWQAALGISFVNHHLSLYSMRGERKRDFPANLFYQQPWWQDEREFSDYIARLCAAVCEGERLVDILVIQPLSSVWSEYSPLHKSTEYAVENCYDVAFSELSKMLMASKLDFHYGNECLMQKYASVKDGKLEVGKHSYSCIIVPPVCNLQSSTLSLLTEFAENGGSLIFTESYPLLIDGEDSNVNISSSVIASSLAEAVSITADLFEDRVKVIDKLTGQNAASVYIHSRRLNNSVRHLFVNTDEKREVSAVIHLPDTHLNTAVFDLCNGVTYKVDISNNSLEVNFAPAGSLLLICSEVICSDDLPLPAFLGSGVSFAGLDDTVPSLLISDLDCEVLEENVLLLNEFVLEQDSKKVYEGPVCGAWHQYFYTANDGTHFKATYTFISEIELQDCFAAIEMAENLDSITFNGNRVVALKQRGELGAFDPCKSWKDINFTKVPLTAVKPGVNTLVIECKKQNNITAPGFHNRVQNWQEHMPTELEEVYICGQFSLNCVSDSRYSIAPFKKPSGKNLTDEGFPFYCGRIRLKADIKLNDHHKGKYYLSLNGLSAACANIYVNGNHCGSLRWKPFVVDISTALIPSANQIEIELASTLANAFGPNRRAGIKEETYITPRSFIEMDHFSKCYELFDFGLKNVALYGPDIQLDSYILQEGRI